MEELWIVHRDASARAALARRLGGSVSVRFGAPDDVSLLDAEAPAVVILGLSGDLERELDFAAQHASRMPATRWILMHRDPNPDEARARFEGLDAQWLREPATAPALRSALSRARSREPSDSLQVRQQRQALLARARRWFADLPELPAPPAPGGVLQIEGEVGSGRLLLAWALHARVGGGAAAFLHVVCDASLELEEILELARASRAGWEPGATPTLCLDGANRLGPRVQQRLRAWLDVGPPAELSPPAGPRWIVLVESGYGPLELELEQALAGARFEIPPLRERPAALAPFVRSTVRAACEAEGRAVPELPEAALAPLAEDPWPGNLRELECVVRRSLATHREDVLGPDDWIFEGTAQAEAPSGEEPEEPLPLPAAELEPEPEIVTEPSVAEPPPPRAPLTDPSSEAGLRRLAGALGHELRNPLVSIRTFASLLPERFQDEEFRTRFREQVQGDLSRIENVLDRITEFAGLHRAEVKPVNISSLLAELLEDRRPQIQERRLLVLQELDARDPYALGHEESLRFAFTSILDQVLEWIVDRADLYVASRHHPSGLRGGPAMRVLLRFHNPHRPAVGLDPEAGRDVAPDESALELTLARELVASQGGELTIDATDAEEMLILIDLPAPGVERPGGAPS